MAKKTKKQTRHSASKPATRSTGSRPNVASYFETKLEAEWGPFDLKRALDTRSQEILVLDTRTSDAYEEEHLPQAINIPTAELENRLSEIPKNKEVVPYCWNITCHLATRAALTLARKGYRVHELVGGIDRWKGSDFPMVTSQKETAIR